jgi:hypothetical protein
MVRISPRRSMKDRFAGTANQIQPAEGMQAFTMITTPTELQRRAFELLGVSHRHGLA